jgi:hypothetical protein
LDEITPKECIQAGEINAGHQRAKMAACTAICGYSNGDLEHFQEKAHRHRLPSIGEILQSCRAGKWEDETAKICCRNGQVLLAPLHYTPQEFKQLFQDPSSLINIRCCCSIFAFTSIGVSLMENSRIDEQLANDREGVQTFRVQGRYIPN